MPRFGPGFWKFVTPPGYASLEEALRDLYEVQGLSRAAVGQKLGVSDTPLRRVFRELGIRTRPHGGYRWGRRREE